MSSEDLKKFKEYLRSNYSIVRNGGAIHCEYSSFGGTTFYSFYMNRDNPFPQVIARYSREHGRFDYIIVEYNEVKTYISKEVNHKEPEPTLDDCVQMMLDKMKPTSDKIQNAFKAFMDELKDK